MSRTTPSVLGTAVVVSCSLAAATLVVAFQGPRGSPSRSKVILTRDLPRLDGAKLVTTVVEVTYDAGGANPAHRHPCPVVGYVLEGHLKMHLQGAPERVVGPGETFYESPDDVHLVSGNASQDHPVRFLAYFVCDQDTPLSVPVPGHGGH